MSSDYLIIDSQSENNTTCLFDHTIEPSSGMTTVGRGTLGSVVPRADSGAARDDTS